MQHTNDERVYFARKLLNELTLPLDTADVTRAREQVRSLSKQYDDYILPRLNALEAPLTVVVGNPRIPFQCASPHHSAANLALSC